MAKGIYNLITEVLKQVLEIIRSIWKIIRIF